MKFSNDVELSDLDYASQGNAILGIRDSGKTYTATWIAERLLDAGIPFVAFDPIGVWRYLRIGAGGNKGYKIVVAGDNADLPLTPESAPLIVRAAMRENIPLILDLYSMSLSKADWKKIVEQSIRLLLYENKEYGTRHIFIEEAAEFCPQRVGPDQGRVYAEIEKLARMGRNASLGYTLINQRPEEVNKAVLELCDCLLLHRQKGRHSLTALNKWLSVAGAENSKEVIKSLPMLKQGDSWLWRAGSDSPQQITTPEKLTVHPDPKKSTPNIYSVSEDVSKFVYRLNESIHKQQKTITIPGATLTTKHGQKALEVNNTDQAKELQEKSEAVTRLENEISELRRRLETEQEARKDAEGRLALVRDMLAPQYETLKKVFESAVVTTESGPGYSASWNIWLAKLTGKQRDMLQVLIDRKRITKKQMALLVGMSAGGGSFNTYRSKLVSLGLVKQEGEFMILQESQP